MYNTEQISNGVGAQRVAEYKQKTDGQVEPLRLKQIIQIAFAVTLSILILVYLINVY